MPGHLFTEYFLTDGIRQTPERRAQRESFAEFKNAARRLFQAFPTADNPNESQTEQDLIRPLLHLLGWTDDLPQQTTSGGDNIPDLLLFEDAEARTRATTSNTSPFLEALAVAELKRFRRPLDSRGKGKGTQASSPHAQILRYLREADTAADGNLRWGVLTNGAVWRLYDQKTRPRATAYFEADLQALLEADDQDALRTFHLLFRRSAFVRRPGAATAFLETALAAGRRYEQRVAQSLAGVVFDRVFPRLLQALADKTDQAMPEIREAALIFLYRLLFILYAEDRGLLPVNDAAYDDYGLRKRVRDDVAQRKARNDTFSNTASSYYRHLTDLFEQIDGGDSSIGLPPYNGGLFADTGAAKLLNQVRLPDDVIADVVYSLSHTQDNGQPRYVNYRDMSVQQLGSLYERLLEQEPVKDDDGRVQVRPNPYARKDSGSFYTPQDLVDLIVDQTLTPLIEERLDAFETRANKLRSDRRPRAERRAELARLDPAQAVLDLKVLDPAMGSGHFLVTAVDVLTDYVADLVEVAPAFADWLPQDDPYQSPLLDRVAAIRADILHRARESNWKVDEAQLTDQAIIRRLVLKRCIYGVDKNPLTVELAKVSLWLHSFTVGAPLSFLDHHLRCGDSLLGLRIADATADLRRLKVPMFVESALQGVENAAQGMRRIEELSDADVTEVHESQSLFHAVESATAHLRGFLDTLTGLRWLTAGLKVRQRATLEAPLAETLGADPTQAFHLLSQGPGSSSPVGVPLVGTHSPPAPPTAGSSVEVPLVGTRSPSASAVRGEPSRSPSQARVEPPAPATNLEPPSSPSHVEPALSLPKGAGFKPASSGQDPQVHDEASQPATPPGSRPLSPLPVGEGQGEGLPRNQPTANPIDPAFRELWTQARAAAHEQWVLHWEAAFPGVWRHWQNHTPEGGFDAVIGNPPWDRIEQQEVEWFALRDPEVALASTGALRKALIKQRQDAGDALALQYAEVRDRATALRTYARKGGHYPLLSGGRTNLYSLFVERALRLVKPQGLVGLLTPSGIYADKTAARFFQSVSTTGRVAGIYDFENRRLGADQPPFFPDIDSRFKFCALIVGGVQRTFPETRCGFFLPGADAINDPERAFTLTPDDFARVNPNTGTAPVFRTRRDADLTRHIYQSHPVLVDRSNGKEIRTWPVRYVQGLFNMTSDSHLFRTAVQLEDNGFYPVQGKRWKRGTDQVLPLYEGKMVQAFDHRAASVVVNPQNLNRPGQPREATLDEHIDPDWLPNPQFWVDEKEIEWPEEMDWVFGFKDITAATNRRTVIASLFPKAAFGNKTPIFLPVAGEAEEAAADYKSSAILLAANFNSFAFDFVARQKVHGQTLNLFILEQLPVIAPSSYHRTFGDRTAADLIRHHVLRLTYTSHDMAPPSPATSATTAHPFPGTPNNAATSAPASTPSTSTSTTSPATTPPTSSPPSPSSNARTKPPSAATAPKTSSSPT